MRLLRVPLSVATRRALAPFVSTFVAPFVAPFVATLLVAIASTGCARTISSSRCDTDEDCIGGTCQAGACSSATRRCVTDLDCDPAAGEVCATGVCLVGPNGSASGAAAGVTSCSATSDCPIDQYCNTNTSACQALLAGWCREAAQCGGAASVCSASSTAVPGRCVECMADGDCSGGAACIAPGVCDGAGAAPTPGGSGTTPTTCSLHASASAGTCVCDPGFTSDGAGACIADGGPGTIDPGTGGPGASPSTSCATNDECYEAFSLDYTCDAGSCVCDTAWMILFVCALDEDVDAATCTCVPATGTGSSSSAGTAQLNDLCDSPDACASGLTCVVNSSTDLFGSCKRTCMGDADCSVDGMRCIEGFFGDQGLCALPQARGATCEGSAWNASWLDVDRICDYGANATDPMLDCFNGRCEEVCDWSTNVDAPLSCSTGTCGPLVYRIEADDDVAVCR